MQLFLITSTVAATELITATSSTFYSCVVIVSRDSNSMSESSVFFFKFLCLTLVTVIVVVIVSVLMLFSINYKKVKQKKNTCTAPCVVHKPL